MAAVAHDLRSPQTSIVGQLGLLEQSMERITDDQQRRVATIREQVSKMRRHLEAMRKLASISAQSLQKADIDLTKLVLEIERRLRDENPQHNVSLKVQSGLTAYRCETLYGIQKTREDRESLGQPIINSCVEPNPAARGDALATMFSYGVAAAKIPSEP